MAEPITGARYVLTPRSDGSYRTSRSEIQDPMAGVSDRERRDLQQYEGMSRLDLMRELRRYQWDAKEYQGQVEQLKQQAEEMPPLHRVQEMAERVRRIRALVMVPRRRVVPVRDLLEVLDGAVTWPWPGDPDGSDAA